MHLTDVVLGHALGFLWLTVLMLLLGLSRRLGRFVFVCRLCRRLLGLRHLVLMMMLGRRLLLIFRMFMRSIGAVFVTRSLGHRRLELCSFLRRQGREFP